tara:strand:- start:727 stop:876 length:150 start_codon:yes stop_codon:yes gene_type:complete
MAKRKQKLTPRQKYVKMKRKLKPIRVEKTQRNDPCPCGSNVKYKKCCME